MNIQVRAHDLDAKLRSFRSVGPAAITGICFLYATVLIPAIESKPLMAVCVTLVIVSLVPFLLRWHAWRVERRVLAELAQTDTPPA